MLSFHDQKKIVVNENACSHSTTKKLNIFLIHFVKIKMETNNCTFRKRELAGYITIMFEKKYVYYELYTRSNRTNSETFDLAFASFQLSPGTRAQMYINNSLNIEIIYLLFNIIYIIEIIKMRL